MRISDWSSDVCSSDLPGECQTFFDIEGDFDLIIDGKRRRNNGKGVRAITHAAFKVALLTFCRSRGLPHPGFLVLDTPRIPFRAPYRPRAAAPAAGTAEIKQSNPKDGRVAHKPPRALPRPSPLSKH